MFLWINSLIRLNPATCDLKMSVRHQLSGWIILAILSEEIMVDVWMNELLLKDTSKPISFSDSRDFLRKKNNELLITESQQKTSMASE